MATFRTPTSKPWKLNTRLMPREVTVTYLQMFEPPDRNEGVYLPDGIRVVRIEQPSVPFYRFLYDAVGAPWAWIDRRKLADAALQAIVQHPAVHIHVLYAGGVLAGYVELDYRRFPDVQIAYFGLLPQFIGRGLGSLFLAWAVDEAWSREPRRLCVNTCTLDHPRALDVYRKAGFLPYKEERKAN